MLLLEAGGPDTNPLIAMPRGFARLFGDPATAWHYPIRPFGPAQQVEHWVRGKTLGGSSSVNGLIYNRGNRADYDGLERLGNPGWGWDDMLPVFEAIESSLQVSTTDETDPLLEDVIAAGTRPGRSRRWRGERPTSSSRIGLIP